MVLTRIQVRRFFKLFDPLTVYANERLDAVDRSELFENGVRGINEQAQAQVARELWQNLNVIDDYVRENPDGLGPDELQVVASWRKGFTSHFVADIFPDGKLRFVGAGHAFEVCGISREIDSMLVELPATVQATLLPFDGLIVYAEYLLDLRIRFGQEMLGTIEHEIGHLYREARIVRTADELLATADEIREEQLQHDIDDMLCDLDAGRFDGESNGFGEEPDARSDDELDDDEGDYAQHRGALAGLSPEERARAVAAYYDENQARWQETIVEIALESCIEGPVTGDYDELLAADDPHEVRRFAKLLGFDPASDADDQAVRAWVVEHVVDVPTLQEILLDFTEYELAALRELADRGGRMSVDIASIDSLRELPPREVGLSYRFFEPAGGAEASQSDGRFPDADLEGDLPEEGTIHFVMPDALVPAMAKVDWDALLATVRGRFDLVSLVDDLVELRGIVPLEDVLAEYRRVYADGFDSKGIVATFLQAIVAGRTCFELLNAGDEGMYALHYELMWEYEDQMGIDRNTADMLPMLQGELGELLSGLLREQEGKPARELSDEMLAADNLFDWKMDQPSVRAFISYLDEHVPDTANDYVFAERVMEELVSEARWGSMERGVRPLFDILESEGFVPDVDQMQDLLDLWTNLANGLPVWPNNGWSPFELAGLELGHPVFLDEKGAPRKIGRNDPCPCGSGLKYKKCCGR